MSEYLLLGVEIRGWSDVLLVREGARRAASRLELSELASVGLATAALEVARNALEHAGGGRAELVLQASAPAHAVLLLVRVTDAGAAPGQPDERPRGGPVAPTGPGSGLAVARRIVEHFAIAPRPDGGTAVEVGAAVALGAETPAAVVERLADTLARLEPSSPCDALHEQSRALVDALARAHQAQQMREDMLSVVSHDLRNPLSVIGMSAAIAVRCDSVKADARALQAVERIDRAVVHMERLISDLLDVASIQAGKLSVARAPHDAHALLAETVEAHRSQARERGVEVVCEARLAGEQVLCDGQRLRQVFANLVGNALKFAPEGSAIVLDAEPGEGHVRFGVHDRGPGIGAAEVAFLFEPYWSAHRHDKRGTGLGLYICKGIIDAHGGEIGVRSAPGEGASFFFTVPRGAR